MSLLPNKFIKLPVQFGSAVYVLRENVRGIEVQERVVPITSSCVCLLLKNGDDLSTRISDGVSRRKALRIANALYHELGDCP